MTKKDICIVIPIYKQQLNMFEVQSIQQCIEILGAYTIHFVAPKGLDVSFYLYQFTSIHKYTFFEDTYFKNLDGYNRLLLSPFFYKKFREYKYMLLYQTDCYVFRDELLYWANLGYDYIGGIWFDNYIGDPYMGAKIWQAGNGGLSLRKIKSITNMLASKKLIKTRKELVTETIKLRNRGRITFLKGMFWLPFYFFGFKNNINYNSKKYQFNEDSFLTETSLKFKSFKIPSVEQAIHFSWDRHPAYLFTLTNKLPFACHAWYRDDSPYEGNKEFWLKQILK